MTFKKENPAGEGGVGAHASVNSSPDYLTTHVQEQFRQAMQAAGINYSGEIIADGSLHRFHIESHKKGTLNGAYVLHGDDRPAGWFQNYTAGLARTWNSGACRRFAISAELSKQIHQEKIQRELDTLAKHAMAADKGRHIWCQSKPIASQSAHPYLVKKCIQPHRARIYKGVLVIPLCDENKKIVNLQFIDEDGSKRFMSGGRKKGCFALIGKQQTPKVLICEGFATGATLHEETDQCVIVAFDAGNLLSVAKNIHGLFPDNEIIICADNDISGVGQAKAREAALAIGGRLLIPEVPGCDFNDLAESRGGQCHD